MNQDQMVACSHRNVCMDDECPHSVPHPAGSLVGICSSGNCDTVNLFVECIDVADESDS